MTPEALAALHARCFTVPRPFNAAEFRGFLVSAHTVLVSRPSGFALGRVFTDEAELLTLAVAPEARRNGHGRALVAELEAEAMAKGAHRVFLEVAEANVAARRLYAAAGYRESGIRKGYYRHAGRPAEDAVVMDKLLKRT